MTDPAAEPPMDRAPKHSTDPSAKQAESVSLAAEDREVEPRALEHISDVRKAGNVTRELTTAAFEGDYANPSEIVPTTEGLTLFRGSGAERGEETEHSRRNGWHRDPSLDLVKQWIKRRSKKSSASTDLPPPAGDAS